MKRTLAAILLLLVVLTLAACGSKEDKNASVPMPTDGGEEAAIHLDPKDPLASYLDLSQLSQETLDSATQELNLTSENNGVQAKLTKVLGDALTLYAVVEITTPENVTPNEAVISAALVEGTFHDPAKFPSMPENSDVNLQALPPKGNTVTYLLNISYQDETLTPGKDVTLLFQNKSDGSPPHLFHWTVQTKGDIRHLSLIDQSGTQVGTAVLSSFGMSAALHSQQSLDLDTLAQEVVLLDLNGKPVLGFQTSGITGDGTNLCVKATSFTPLELSNLSTLKIGTFSALVN